MMKTYLPKISCSLLLFFCAHMQSAQAQIVYTDVTPDSVFSANNDTLSIDLNHDAVIDFKLITNSKTISSTYCAGTKINKYLKVTPADTNNAVLNYSNLPGALDINTTIDSSSQVWKNKASQIMAADTNRCISGGGRPGGFRWYNLGSGNFRNTTDKYLAVRFYAGTKLYYGWIRFDVGTNLTVTMKDYAYQSSGKQTILAGQTGDTYFSTVVYKKTPICAGDSIKVGYVMAGNFDPANEVTVEWSDSLGSFSNPTVLRTVTSNISGTIPCKIPSSISGNAYRFRVRSSNPAQIATDNGTNLMVNKSLADTLITPAQTQVLCSGGSVMLTAQPGNGNTYQWKKDNANLTGYITRTYLAFTTGLFRCAITNGCGTVQSSVVSLTILPALPAISITPAGPLTIKTGDSVELRASTIYPDLDHRWYRNAVLLNPLKSAFTYMAKTAGTYTLKITDTLYGCSYTTYGMILNVADPSSIAKANAAQTSLKVQPNPFSNAVLISFSIPDRQKFSVKIVDLAGRVVKTIASDITGGGKFEYTWKADDQNGKSICSGIYLLKLEGNTFSQTEKLMLVR